MKMGSTLKFSRVHQDCRSGSRLSWCFLGGVLLALGLGQSQGVHAQAGARKLVVWGGNLRGEGVLPPRLTTRVKTIAAGPLSSMVLTEDDRILAWGYPEIRGSEVPLEVQKAEKKQVLTSGGHSLAITQSGQVLAWGNNHSGQGSVPQEVSEARIRAISVGNDQNLVLTEQGKVIAWGDNSFGQTDTPTSIASQRIKMIAAGYGHNPVLTQEGQVLEGQRARSVFAGNGHNLAISEEGKVLAWGRSNRFGQTQVPRWVARESVRAAAVGSSHNLVLTQEGRVLAWGSNHSGEIDVPPEVNAPGVTVLQIAAGSGYSMALIEVPAFLANGESCFESTACQSGLCVHGVCSEPNADRDNDGIPDAQDHCFGTSANQVVDTGGCSISQRCVCEQSWERGGYMDCVRAGTRALESIGKLDRDQARRINLRAFDSEGGQRRRSERERIRDRLKRVPNLPDWMRGLSAG